ncbi:MAG: histidine kinase, partial [Vulcanimicrobiaceae bacterium]
MRPGSNRELRILSGVAELLGGETDLREALERTLALVAGFLGLRTGWIWLVDPDTQQFYIAAAYRLPPYLRAPVRMAGTWCQCTDALRQGELRARNVDVIECTRLLPAVKRRRTDLTQGLRYHATIPLYFRDRPLGVMNLTDRSWRELSRDELRLLSTVALQISTALERARLAEAATGAARADERTRIARELHDTIAQRFTAIALQLEGALKGSAPSEGRSPAKIERALELARDGVEEARRSLFDLRSAPPAGKPLAQALAA